MAKKDDKKTKGGGRQAGPTATINGVPQGEKPKGINSNVKRSTREKVIAALEEREASGKMGPNDAKRLAALRGDTMPGVPRTGGGLTVDDNIDTKTGRITNPQDLIDQAGKLYDPTDPYWTDIYNKTYNTQYDLSTSGLDERKTREMEEARQIAAERGLPFDPNGVPRDSARGKLEGGINDRYDNLYKDATNSATMAAQGAWETQGSLANDSYVKHIQSVLGISEAEARAYANELAKQGIDKDYKAKMAAVAASNKPSGGGGSSGGGGGGSSSGGFDVVL